MAQLHFGSLAKKHNRRAVLVALETLPNELNDTYDEVMKRIFSQDEEEVDLAKRVLGWLLYAKRPLTTGELQHALSVTPDSRELDEAALTEEGDLISVCAGIVTIERETNIIRWVHYTTQKYFERVGLPDAQADIAMVCLTYLSFDVFENLCGSRTSLRERLQNYPFGLYAARFWGVHTRDVESLPAIQERTLAFLASKGKTQSMGEMTLAPTTRWFVPMRRRWIGRGWHLLHILANEGLVEICALVIDQGLNTEHWYVPKKTPRRQLKLVVAE